MKKTQVTELFANIRSTAVSFFSILLFVALGVCLYCGMRWTSLAIKNSNSEAFVDGNVHALEVTFSYGLTDDDLSALREVEGVDAVEAGYLCYQDFKRDGASEVALVRSVPGSIDKLTILEGAAPAAVGEAAVTERYAEQNGVGIGDTITFEHDAASTGDAGASAGDAGSAADADTNATADADGMAHLTCDTVKIVGIARNATTFLNADGALGSSSDGRSVSCALFVPEATFDFLDLDGAHNVAELSCSSLDGLNVYSDEYRERVEKISDAVKELGQTRAKARSEAIVAKAQAKVDDARAELEAAKAQVNDGNTQVSEAQSELDTSTQSLRDSQVKLETTSELLASQESTTSQTLAQTGEQLASMRAQYNAASETLAQKQAEYNQLFETYTAEYQKVLAADAFISTARLSFANLQTQKAALDARKAAGELDDAAYNDELQKLCDEHNAAMSQAKSDFAAAAPDIYESNKTYVDQVFMTFSPSTPDFDNTVALSTAVIDEVETSFAPAKQSAEQAHDMMESASADMNGLSEQLESFGAQLDAAEQQYQTNLETFNSTMASKKSQVASGLSQVQDGQAQISDSQAQIDEKRTELQKATEKLQESEAKLKEAQARVDSTSEMEWAVRGVRFNTAMRSTEKAVGSLENLRFAMASLFVIVGLLVCYSAVSRIVHEQVVLVGTKKAVGFRDREIILSYLAYSGMAVVAGSLIGAVLAVVLVESIMLGAMNYTVLPDPTWAFDVKDYLVIAAIELVLILLSTYLACKGVLRRDAIKLLQGAEPPSGRQRFYERWPVWKRLGLFTQTVVNNCVNDRRRVLATVVGVAGCCSLLVCAFYLKGNIDLAVERQTSAILAYDAVVYCEPTAEGAEAASGTVDAQLAAEGLTHVAVMKKAMALEQPDGNFASADIVVPRDNESFSGLYHLFSQGGSTGTEAPLDGAWVNEGYSAYFNAKVGDKIKLVDALGQEYEVPIAGFFECHSTYAPVVMSAACYEKYLGETATCNAYLVDAGGKSAADLAAGLAGSASDYAGYTDVMTDVNTITGTSGKLTFALVVVYVILAAMLAVIVLLNLNVMFINEKKRELIVLMINGYSTRDAKRYIYRDTIVMTAIGIVAGCFLGVWAGELSVRAADGPSVSFCHEMIWSAVGISAALCALFTAAVTLIALRRIEKFQLTDINKP
ncbi:ABC transporter permease [Paratractidigestivibacter sp.]|uniref:ABC transporter permease n=1 Tax=Paratractidigestivibacter sp. TaxID=2847316 RepID=UPI002ACB0AB0|nr:FtsX-like permease family protein [Paratractidigestivibacter sp.]